MSISDISNSTPLSDDLRISITPGVRCCFEGTSAQLRAEGLIPKKEKWPARDIPCQWTAAGFHFDLRRKKPEGLKAPKAEWMTVDNWLLVRSLNDDGCASWDEAIIREKMQEIERIKFRNSRDGRIQADKWGDAYRDQDYQAFKARIPGMIKPKLGRKAKAE